MRHLDWLLPLALLAVIGAMSTLILPVITAGSGGLPPFDTRLTGYSLAEARAYLEVLTPEAKAAYLGPFRLADTVTPVLLGLTLMLPLRGRSWAAFLPAAAYLLADLAEDWAVAQILLAGPGVTAAAVTRGSVLTMVKFAALALAVGVAILALATRLGRRGRA